VRNQKSREKIIAGIFGCVGGHQQNCKENAEHGCHEQNDIVKVKYHLIHYRLSLDFYSESNAAALIIVARIAA
jgi:hypothetical protein